MSDAALASPAGAGGRRSGELFGHPTCLFTLFFAEMWERFSFYGMKALLILYMVNYLFWRQDDASLVMAWYAGLVYATPVLGGIIADKLTGARWAVVIGGVIIAIGHFLLAFEPLPFFYSGLGCLVVGTGFLKPNISTQVGALYRSHDERRDSAFTIFYMGINLGAFIGPLVCGWLRLHYSYHHGFAAAGVGMVIGLIVYISGMRSVVRREKQIQREEAEGEADEEEPSQQPGAAGEPAAKAALGERRRAAAVPTKVYVDRAIVLVVICVFAILFWVGFEQAANVMNLWADKHTNLHVFEGQAPTVALPDAKPAPATGGDVSPTGAAAPAGFQLTAEQTQSINPFYIITLAAVFAWLWQWLDRRGRQPSTPVKMMMGVFFLTCAYGIMLMAAQAENREASAPLAELPEQLDVDETGRVYQVVKNDGKEKQVYFGATRLRWSEGVLRMNGVLTDLDWMRVLGASSPESYQEAVQELAEQAQACNDHVADLKRSGELPREAVWQVSVDVPEELGDLHPIASWPEHDKTADSAPLMPMRWAAADVALIDTAAVERERLLESLYTVILHPQFARCVADFHANQDVPALQWQSDTEDGHLQELEPLHESEMMSMLVAGVDAEFRDRLIGLYAGRTAPVAWWDPGTRRMYAADVLSDKDQAQLLAAGADPGFRDAVTEIYQKSSTLKVSIVWLLTFYLVLTIGELCLSPVGLSLVTKAAHPKYVGLFMGFWFFTTGAVSNFLAHFVGGYWGQMTPGTYFLIFGVLGLIATVIMLLLLRVLKPMLHGIH